MIYQDKVLLLQTMVTSHLVCEPLQMVQNQAERLLFHQPNRSHDPPHLTDLHWLPESDPVTDAANRETSGSAAAV